MFILLSSDSAALPNRCAAAGHGAAARLSARLQALLPPSTSAFAAATAEAGPVGAIAAEGALLLARVAAALGSRTPSLQVCFRTESHSAFAQHRFEA